MAVPRCPRCGGPIPNALHPGEYPGALSRYDNETEVCSSCGQDEAVGPLFGGPLMEWVDGSGRRS